MTDRLANPDDAGWVTYADPSKLDMGRTLTDVRTYGLTDELQDLGENRRVPDAPDPVDNEGSAYVETAADHQFSAFLAGLTPSKVLRDRERNFSPAERKRQTFLRQKAHAEALSREVARG